MKRKGNIEFKREESKSRDLISHLSDIHLISYVLIYLSLSEIRSYSYTCKGNRKLTLHLGLNKYKLHKTYSKCFYKNGVGEMNEIGEKIRLQVVKGARIISLDLSNILYETLDENILGIYLEILLLGQCKELKYVSNLGYVKELKLLECPKVKDVSGLGKVHKLAIGGKYGDPVTLEGVEALCNVHDLELKYCAITDLSPFSNINTLTLIGCTNVTDVSALSNVSKLSLQNFTRVADISALSTVKDLHIWYFPLVTDISALSTVPKLYIGYCTGIIDVSVLHTVADLTLIRLDKITDVSMLSSIPKLKIGSCSRITNWGSIPSTGNSIHYSFNNRLYRL